MKKFTYLKKRGPNNGIALIIVLGLLSVLTLLAVAFAIAMRVERLAARNHVNTVRARHMIQTGLSWAIDDISESLLGATYPVGDAFGSESSTGLGACDFLEGEATNEIPPALLAAAEGATAEWREVAVPGLTGRVAYLVVNCSGCLDPHFIGGNVREWSTNVSEIDISSTISHPEDFLSDRADHVRYETVAETRRINSALYPYPEDGRSLFPYSLDIGRDLYYEDTDDLGLLNAVFKKKFEINSITNYTGYYEPDNYSGYSGDALFISEYFNPLRDLLEAAGLERPPDVVWNIVNYLDEDRIPQCGETYPWRHTEGNEAIPLINEIVFRRSPDAPPAENKYEFAIELWYPFAPVSVTDSDNFRLDVAVFKTNWTGTGAAPIEYDFGGGPCIMDFGDPDWSFSAEIDEMSFGGPNEFMVIKSPEPNWISFISNGVIGGANAVWMLARVMKDDLPVDEAMGYDRNNENSGSATALARRALKKYSSEGGYAINDPRVNGQCRYWNPSMSGAGGTASDCGYYFADPEDNSLGTTNTAVCSAWYGYKTHGTPIWAKNGLMLNIAELGHIYRSNLDDEMPMFYRFWRNVDLMHRDEGAALMDWTTARINTNEISGTIADHGTNYVPQRGLVNISSRQFDSLYALVNNLEIGTTNEDWTGMFPIDPIDASNLVETLIYNGPYLHYRDIFTDEADGGPNAVAFRQCVPTSVGAYTNDILQEDTFRRIAELITFRQNIFQVLVAAQALAKDGEAVVGEKRALATVVRDSYTGVYFVRSFKWLDD